MNYFKLVVFLLLVLFLSATEAKDGFLSEADLETRMDLEFIKEVISQSKRCEMHSGLTIDSSMNTFYLDSLLGNAEKYREELPGVINIPQSSAYNDVYLEGVTLRGGSWSVRILGLILNCNDFEKPVYFPLKEKHLNRLSRENQKLLTQIFSEQGFQPISKLYHRVDADIGPKTYVGELECFSSYFRRCQFEK